MDGLGFHPYPLVRLSDPNNYFTATLAEVRSIISSETAAGREYPGRRLWANEFGVKSGLGEPWNEAQARDDLRAAYGMLDASDDVDVAIFHTLSSPPFPETEYRFSWLRSRDLFGRIYARNVYCAFAHEFGQGFDCSQPVPLTPNP